MIYVRIRDYGIFKNQNMCVYIYIFDIWCV